MSVDRDGRAIAGWVAAAVAVVALAKAVVDAQAPAQSTDLHLVREWAELWLVKGESPYDARPPANYPPQAIVLFAPLALLPGSAAALAWSVLNAALAPVVGWMGYAGAHPGARRRARVLPVALFCAWGGLLLGIKNGQFSLVVVALGLAAVRLGCLRPALAGLLLGLSTAKPHVSVAFVLWGLLTSRWKLLAVAAVSAGALIVTFCLRIGADPRAVLLAYGRALWDFSGPSFVPGDLELRPLVHASIGHAPLAELTNGVAVVALAAAVWLAARRLRAARGEEVLALAAVWTLAAFFHNDYDTILLLPAAAVLWHSALVTRSSSGGDRLVWLALQAALVVDVPTLWKRLVASGLARSGSLPGVVLPHVDRAVVLALLAYLLLRAGAGGREVARSPALDGRAA